MGQSTHTIFLTTTLLTGFLVVVARALGAPLAATLATLGLAAAAGLVVFASLAGILLGSSSTPRLKKEQEKEWSLRVCDNWPAKTGFYRPPENIGQFGLYILRM